MKTTIESSLPFVAEIACLSPGARQYIYALGDELQRQRTIGDKKALHARDMRTAWVEAHIEDVIRAKRPALVIKPRRSWTGILMLYYINHGIEAPDIETVRRVVKEFNGF